MKSYSITCILIGDNFSPKKLEKNTDLNLFNKNEKNDIATKGRFKGNKTPYGSAEIEIIIINDFQSDLHNLLDLLGENINSIQKSDCDDIYITLNVEYEDQCNLEFENELLKKIVNLNVSFSVSCFKNG